MVFPSFKAIAGASLQSFPLAVLEVSVSTIKSHPVNQCALSDASENCANNELPPSLFPFL